MARYIHCPECNKRMAANAAKFGELYESVEGVALYDMFCDGAHDGLTEIKQGDKCFAAVLLDNSKHPNYRRQHPDNWAHDFISKSENKYNTNR